MIRVSMVPFGCPLVCVLLLGCTLHAGEPSVEQLLNEVRAASFPELSGVNIRVRPYHSDSVFIAAQFEPIPFLFGANMQYAIRSNPMALQAPVDGMRAILAHELSHIVYYSQGKRFRLLGLVRLVSASYRQRFERATDVEAIRRGYGDGLKEYRQWLYQTVPPKALPGKRRDYLSPEEIDAVMAAGRHQ